MAVPRARLNWPEPDYPDMDGPFGPKECYEQYRPIDPHRNFNIPDLANHLYKAQQALIYARFLLEIQREWSEERIAEALKEKEAFDCFLSQNGMSISVDRQGNGVFTVTETVRPMPW